jgi:tRNA-dihydrouridine synthase B
MLDKTGADGLGIARGALGKPWIFRQIKDYLKTGKYHTYSPAELNNAVIAHAKLNEKHKGKYGIIEMRKQLAWYYRARPGISKLRSLLVRVESVGELKEILKTTVTG